MRIILELPEYLVREARKLISEGRYSDISSFIVASVENQLTLEKSDMEPGTLLVEGVREWKGKKRPSVTTEIYNARRDYSGVKRLGYPKWEGRGEERWLWGQINKILPIKFVARLLANELSGGGEPPLLEEFAKSAAAAARAFGLDLKRFDEREGHAWGERLSTAFPISDKVDKALGRFGSQFVGYVRGDGEMSGALLELKLGNVMGQDKDIRIGLTAAGWKFAQLTNPVLDERDYSRPLSEEEIDFYLDHIIRRVPWEATAFRLILSILDEGVTGREEVNSEIGKRLAVGWSAAQANTERAGTMARMFQLRLLDRERDGIKVEYKVTERGMKWLRGNR
jgi:Arc/MetJ-type ribon-helix-helix transcriptional regulator